MQTKLTLTIEQDLIEYAKKYAKSKGRSLSDLIENYLMLLLEEQNTSLPLSSEIKKMKGAIKLPSDFNYKKSLGKSLVNKYKA